MPSTQSEELNILDITKVEVDDHTPPMLEVVKFEFPQGNPIIFIHGLRGISPCQSLKFRGYIKHCKMTILVDSWRTHILYIRK